MARRTMRNHSAEIEKLAKGSDSSPFAQLLDMKIVRAEQGYALASLAISEEKHLNFDGHTHGAVIFALADHAGGLCGNSLGRKAVLVHSSINFFANPAPGSVMEAEARIVHAGKKTGSLNIEVRGTKGKLLAHCQFVIYFLPEA